MSRIIPLRIEKIKPSPKVNWKIGIIKIGNRRMYILGEIP